MLVSTSSEANPEQRAEKAKQDSKNGLSSVCPCMNNRHVAEEDILPEF